MLDERSPLPVAATAAGHWSLFFLLFIFFFPASPAAGSAPHSPLPLPPSASTHRRPRLRGATRRRAVPPNPSELTATIARPHCRQHPPGVIHHPVGGVIAADLAAHNPQTPAAAAIPSKSAGHGTSKPGNPKSILLILPPPPPPPASTIGR
jgi:hypothetical protein